MLAFVAAAVVSCAQKDYDSVKGDPLNARIYTLDNGLKVYMAVNKEEPRIQTYIAVRTGGKNDPSETTGLAHYFEHLMFKGTQQFGTSDYATEKPMLDQIEQLFELYRTKTDEVERAAIYHQIDSVSYEASKIAIPNEYDKLMAAIGAEGTNAYTGYDQTVYVEDIPSNQIDNWAKIQADRFKNVTIRGFHTELETIYEEKNMSLTQDSRKVWENIYKSLFKHHPYGLQTVLGTQEHLKNPSITNVKKYHDTWYVPNNIAICLSGDFDPDQMIATIKKHFGDWEPNADLPVLSFPAEDPITTPSSTDVFGLEAENVTVAWRLGKYADPQTNIAQLASSILSNGQAGLMDLDLNQQQKVLQSFGGSSFMADAGMFVMQGRPKEGQTLDEVRDLMLAEVAKMRSGDFDEGLLEAAINNYIAQIQNYMDSNNGRADMFVESFINGIDWADEVNRVDAMRAVTKEQIVEFANSMLADNSYIVVYKRQGPDPDEQKIAKPTITPIVTNRDQVSPFLSEIQNSVVTPIEPVFVDYNKDMSKFTASDRLEVLYKQNTTTDLFNLNYVFETGFFNDPVLPVAFRYFEYLGTNTMSYEQLASELYKIACSVNFNIGEKRSYITVSGLSENMARAMELTEQWLADPKGDAAILENIKGDMIKSRTDAKANQRSNFAALQRYSIYGPQYVTATTLDNNQLQALESEQLLSKVKNFPSYDHYVLYYGPMSRNEFEKTLAENHNIGDRNPVPEKVDYIAQLTPENRVYLAQYDAKQIYFIEYSNRGEQFDVANDAKLSLYNEYFGGGMNSIVFQEMREARGLAYSASAYLSSPGELEQPYYFMAFIATQNDKMGQAVDAFDDIINNMPESEAAFKIAKDALIARLRTQRTIKSNVLWSYIDDRDLNLTEDRNKAVYEQVQNMTLEDVKAVQKQWVKDRTYSFVILGDIKDLDINKLTSMGQVSILGQEQIFGY